MIFALLGFIVAIGSCICTLIILISAFQDELWKGLVGLFCSLYLLYYGIVEFQNDNKVLILSGAYLGGAVAGVLISLGRASLPAH